MQTDQPVRLQGPLGWRVFLSEVTAVHLFWGCGSLASGLCGVGGDAVVCPEAGIRVPEAESPCVASPASLGPRSLTLSF